MSGIGVGAGLRPRLSLCLYDVWGMEEIYECDGLSSTFANFRVPRQLLRCRPSKSEVKNFFIGPTKFGNVRRVSESPNLICNSFFREFPQPVRTQLFMSRKSRLPFLVPMGKMS